MLVNTPLNKIVIAERTNHVAFTHSLDMRFVTKINDKRAMGLDKIISKKNNLPYLIYKVG